MSNRICLVIFTLHEFWWLLCCVYIIIVYGGVIWYCFVRFFWTEIHLAEVFCDCFAFSQSGSFQLDIKLNCLKKIPITFLTRIFKGFRLIAPDLIISSA